LEAEDYQLGLEVIVTTEQYTIPTFIALVVTGVMVLISANRTGLTEITNL